MKAVKLAILFSAVLATSISLNAADQTKPKEKAASKVADSGSFGIFMNVLLRFFINLHHYFNLRFSNKA